MKQKQLVKIFLLTISVWHWGAIGAAATEVPKQEVQSKSVASVLRNSRSIRQIRQLSEIERPSTSAQMLVQTPAPIPAPATQVVPITGVKANPTQKGVEVILETTQGEQLQVTNRSTGNNFIVDIIGGQLRLASGDAFTFRSQKPITGITEITVTNVDANTVRVTVIGEKALPTVELFDDNAGLVFAVASQATALPAPQQPPQTPASETPQEQPSAESDEPIELVVTGEQDGYRVPDASTATRTDTPLRDIPASIQVIPRQVIEDRNIERVQDALENVSGVTKGGNYGGTAAGAFVIRGFSQDGNFRNGLRDNGFNSLSDFASIERVEVLKGPASVLFGQVEPGGIINLVTKQPLNEPYYSVEFTAENYNFYRPTFDISGPLNAEKTVLYRLNAAYQNSGSFRDFVDSERFFIAPALTWKIGSNTTLDLDFEYLQDDSPFDRGLVILDDNSLPLPINRNLNYPLLHDFNQRIYRGGYRFEHRFSDNWRIRNNFFLSSVDRGGFSVNPEGRLIDNRFSPRVFYDERNVTQNYTVQTDLIGKFNTGSIAHQLLLGFDFNRNTSFYEGRSASLPPNDIFNPVFEIPRPTVLSDPEIFSDRTDTWGIYLQDQVTLLDNLKLLVGGRFDFSTQNNLVDPRSEQFNDAFSPRVGIVYQPSQAISLYASYSTSFVPAIGLSASDSPFKPEKGKQFEVGIKGEFLDGKLSATLAAFDITKSNILTTDPNPNNSRFSIQVGEQQSQGIELDVIGEILPGWNIIATYAYIDARVTEDNTIPIGNRLPNSAQHTASFWTTY
ncbi:TonB-dependent siderophore receptor, partial [Tolypothrix sp. VBCCA 56010]|uniref:TonB-dependent siderophore receptor n=1 Tax=Tolypothrix sp. VBCCA 56010 TaxID=3137731 RepID=UPI003D7EBE3D